MKFITVSGIDKSGKTTLIKAFMEETNYQHYVVDRDPSNYFFFNVIRDRIKDVSQVSEYGRFQRKFSDFVDLAILLKVNEKDWSKRCEEHKEDPLVGQLSMKNHQKEIEEFFDNAKYKNYLKLNTSILSIEECVNEIKGKINDLG